MPSRYRIKMQMLVLHFNSIQLSSQSIYAFNDCGRAHVMLGEGVEVGGALVNVIEMERRRSEEEDEERG